MQLKDIISSEFNEVNFKDFIQNTLGLKYGEDSNFTKIDDNLEYKKIVVDGELKDRKQIEIIILKSNKSVERARVKYNEILEKIVKNNTLDLALMAIYNENDLSTWKLSLVVFDESKKLTNSKRYTFELGKDIPIKTALSQLSILNKNSKSEDYLEAFSVEKVSKVFFNEYKKLYEDICIELKPQIAYFDTIENIEFFTKKLLGRVVFLYFLQKKGWLGSGEKWGDGDKKFLTIIILPS